MTIRRVVAWAAALAGVVALTACSSTSTPTNPPTASISQGAIVGTWTVEHTFDTPEQPFVSFSQDHSWSASDGCDRVYGSWKLASSGRLSVVVGPHAALTCDGQALPLAVTHGSSVRQSGDSLTLRSSTDSTVTTLTRSTEKTVGPQGRPIGYWVAGKTPTSPYLSVRADGSFRSYDGCVTVTGTWVFSNTEQLRLRPTGSVPAVCTGVDQWLSKAASARVSDGVMTVLNGSGSKIGQLSAF